MVRISPVGLDRFMQLAIACAVILNGPQVWASERIRDGRWTGELQCFEHRGAAAPTYSQPIDAVFQEGRTFVDLGDAHSIFRLALVSDDTGRVEGNNTGGRRSDPTKDWLTKLEGRYSGDGIEVAGTMRAQASGRVLRERCALNLRWAGAVSAAPPPPPPSAQGEEPTPSEQASRPYSDNNTKSGDAPANHGELSIRRVDKPTPSEATNRSASGMPVINGVPTLPPSWLFGGGQPWHYRSPQRSSPPVPIRAARESERQILAKTRGLVAKFNIEVIALIDQGHIVDVVASPRVHLHTHLLSVSVAKTLTAVAAGAAVCAGHITLETRAQDTVPGLTGTHLGSATLRDLLMMASGTVPPEDPQFSGLRAAEIERHLSGTGNLEQLLLAPGHTVGQRGFLSTVKPGEVFSYKFQDPLLVALMIERATGMRATRWVQEAILDRMQSEYPAILGTDRTGLFHGAGGSVRMALIDWIRFAIFVQQERTQDTCLGRHLRAMTTTQIHAPFDDHYNGFFQGYGYFTWTQNTRAPNTAWAVGYGGQRIGWSNNPDNGRVFLMFSTSADRDMAQIYPVAQEWIRLGRNGRP